MIEYALNNVPHFIDVRLKIRATDMRCRALLGPVELCGGLRSLLRGFHRRRAARNDQHPSVSIWKQLTARPAQ